MGVQQSRCTEEKVNSPPSMAHQGTIRLLLVEFAGQIYTSNNSTFLLVGLVKMNFKSVPNVCIVSSIFSYLFQKIHPDS